MHMPEIEIITDGGRRWPAAEKLRIVEETMYDGPSLQGLFVTTHSKQRSFGAGGGSRTHTGIRPTDFKSGMSTIPSRPHLASSSNFQFRAYIGPENSLFVATPCSVCTLQYRPKDFKSAAYTNFAKGALRLAST